MMLSAFVQEIKFKYKKTPNELSKRQIGPNTKKKIVVKNVVEFVS